MAIAPFRRLWLALGLSSFGDWLGLLATSALAGTLAQTPATRLLAVSGVFVLRLAPAVLFGPLAGVLADRLPRRWILVVGDVLRFGLFCTIPIVGTLWWLYVATVLVEIVGLFWTPAKDATVPTLVPRRRLEAANQLSLAVTYGSAPVAALAFAGLSLLNGVLDGLIPHLGASQTYLALYVNAITFGISAVVIWRLELPVAHGTGDRQESVWRTAIDGWKFVGQTPLVRGLVLGMLGAFAAGGVVIGLGRSFVTDLRAGDPGYGTLFAAVFIGMAGGMWLAPRLLADFPRRRLFGLSIAVAGVWLVLLSLVPNIALAVFFTVGLGVCAGTAWVTGYTMLGLEVGDEIRGRTFAIVQSLVRVVLVAVLAIAPVLAAGLAKALSLPHSLRVNEFVSLTYTGVMATFLIAGLIAVLIGVLAYRQMDDRPDVSLLTDLRAAVRRPVTDVVPRRVFAGRFIAFEGGDGAGKSTQARMLGQWLQEQGFTVTLTREPGATPTGAKLREVLLHGPDLAPRAEALLFAADRAHHVETVVRPGLMGGAIVVTDRYCDSSVAYQSAGRGLDREQVQQLSRWGTEGLVPDLTVLLDIEPADAARRRVGEQDRLESEPEVFHDRVREGFLDLARAAPSRYLVVDAALGPQEVHRQVLDRLSAELPESPVARVEREAAEAAERARRMAQEVAERAERKAQEVAERAERKAREAAEQAEREARAAEQHRIREEAAAALAARRAVEQRARLDRAAIEATARAERERRRVLREAEQVAARQAAEAERLRQLRERPLPPTRALPIVTVPIAAPGRPATAERISVDPATPAPATPERATLEPDRADSIPDFLVHRASDPGDAPEDGVSLGEEIFRLGRRDQR
jgi:dTMP kinase